MNFATMILSQRIVEALGWTLFHSLWQGALAALGFAVILYFSRRTSSRMRYGLGLAVLALMLLVSVLTFWNHYNAAGPDAIAHRPGQIAAAAASLPAADESGLVANAEPTSSQRIVAFFSDYFSRHLPLLVTLWLLGVLFLTLRFSGSMLYLQRLKYRQNRPLPAPWPDRLRQLAEKAGLQRPLQLLETLRLQTPVVIGHFKPVLLLPAGLAAGLPVDEVEALLAHELAHVMRRDYLVNVLQNLVEILYFFHPGVRWLSACVRQEREHCCDDFAVALCGDAQHYARALARLQAGEMPYPKSALAAVGRPQKLLRRIVRLLGRPRLAHDFREGFVSALLLIFGLLGMLKLAAVTGGAVPIIVHQAKAQGAQSDKARAANPFEHVSFELEADGVVKLSGAGGSGSGAGTWLVDGRDGQVIWFMDLAQASGKGSFSAEVPLGSGAYAWYRPGGWKVTAQWSPSAGAWEPLTMLIGRRAAGGGEIPAGQEGEQYRRQQARLEKKMIAAEEQGALAQLERLKDQEKRMRAEEMHMRAEEERMRAEEKNFRALIAKEEERMRAAEERMRAEEKNFRALIAELSAAGLVKGPGRYEIRISAAQLLVNGKKQPAAVHERIKKFYEAQFNKKLTEERSVTIVNDK